MLHARSDAPTTVRAAEIVALQPLEGLATLPADPLVRPEQAARWVPANSDADIGVFIAVPEPSNAPSSIRNCWFASKVTGYNATGSGGGVGCHVLEICDGRYPAGEDELSWETDGSLAALQYAYLGRALVVPQQQQGLDDRTEFVEAEEPLVSAQSEQERAQIEGMVQADIDQALADSKAIPILGPSVFPFSALSVLASAAMNREQNVKWRKTKKKAEVAAAAAVASHQSDSDDESAESEEVAEDGERGGLPAGAAAPSVGTTQCAVCQRWFNLSHVTLHKCKGPVLRQDIHSRAVRFFLKELQSKTTIQTCTRLTRSIKQFAPKVPYNSRELPWPGHTGVARQLQHGWGCREPHGASYGALYIGPFKPLLESMFQKGNVDKRFKYSPAMMQEQLFVMYPKRYDLPSIIEVQIFISTISQKKKQSDKASL